METINFEKLSKVALIELRNDCIQELQRRQYQVPEIKDIPKNAVVKEHLFGEQYYIAKIKTNDYSNDQLILMRQKARDNNWGKLLALTEKDTSGLTKKIDATAFLSMMESK